MCGTGYHYKVYAVDAAGTTGMTTDAMFTTLACNPDVIAPILTGSVTPTKTTATVFFSSNENGT